MRGRVPKVGVANTNVDHLGVAFVIADFGTRDGELYAPANGVLLCEPPADGGATNLAPGDRCGEDRFARSRARLELMLGWLGGEEAGGLEHADLESRIGSDQAAERASPKLKTRLSKGEKANRKRIAEVGAVYELTPAPRTPEEVLASTEEKTMPAPKAKRKWLTASVRQDAAAVIAEVFEEAQRRDPDHRRTWVALVDGNNHQIDRIKKEAKARKAKVTILIDLVHVLE